MKKSLEIHRTPHKVAGIFFSVCQKKKEAGLTGNYKLPNFLTAPPFGKHAQIPRGRAGHIANLYRSTVILCRNNSLLFIFQKYLSLLRQNVKNILSGRSRMRISAFCSIKNTRDTCGVINKMQIWCVLEMVSLEFPALCYLGAGTLWKKTDRKAKLEEQEALAYEEILCETNRPSLISP